MTVDLDRDLLAQITIALSVCIGGWLSVVKPKADELRELHAQIEHRRSSAPELNHDLVRALAARAPRLRSRSEEIRRRGAATEDWSALYSQVRRLAGALDVEIQYLKPGAELAGSDPMVRVTRIDLKAAGEYARIAEFLAAMDELEAYLRPVALQVTPRRRGGADLAEVRLGLDAVRFDLPKDLDFEAGGTT